MTDRGWKAQKENIAVLCLAFTLSTECIALTALNVIALLVIEITVSFPMVAMVVGVDLLQ